MRKFLTLCIIMLLGYLQLNGQELAEFTADRPGASTGPTVVGHKVIQLEQGVQYDGDGDYGTFTFSNTLLRYGLFPNMELRLGGDGFIYRNTGGDRKWSTAFSGLSFGTKIRCYEGEGLVPAVSVLADFAIPHSASSGFDADHLAPSLYLLFENPVCDWLSIGYNIGAEWDGTLPKPTTFAALCFGISATEKLGCFIESYNYFGSQDNQYAMDFGMNWQVSRKVQFDIAANLDLTDPAKCWAISCGIAWQINR